MQTRYFNLINHPWIRALYNDGSNKTLTLRQVFEDWNEIHSVNGSNTKATFCIQQLLALITAKVSGGFDTTDGYKQVLEDDRLGSKVVSYLNSVQHLFTIGDPTHPFLQVPALNGMVDKSQLDTLRLSDITKTDGILGYPHTLLHPPSFSGPELAEFLLREWLLSGYGLCGGPIKERLISAGITPSRTYSASGAIAPNKTHVLPKAGTLRESLLLNVPPELVDDEAVPPWMRSRGLVPSVETPNTSFGLTSVLTRSTLLFWDEAGEVTSVFTGVGDKLPSEYCEALPKTQLVHTAPRRHIASASKTVFASPQKLQANWDDLKNFFLVGADAVRAGYIQAPIISWIQQLKSAGLLPKHVSWELTHIVKAGKTNPTISACLINEVELPEGIFSDTSEYGLELFSFFKFISDVERNFFSCNSQAGDGERGEKSMSPLALLRKYRELFKQDAQGALKTRTKYPMGAQFLPIAKEIFDACIAEINNHPERDEIEWEQYFASKKLEVLELANDLWQKHIFSIPLATPKIVMAVGKSTAQVQRLTHIYKKQIEEITNG